MFVYIRIRNTQASVLFILLFLALTLLIDSKYFQSSVQTVICAYRYRCLHSTISLLTLTWIQETPQ
jgi:hypothetical protein